MSKKRKSVIGAIALSAAMLAAVCFSGCTPSSYSIDKLDGVVKKDEVVSNGGFVVEKGDYVYFINGKDNYTAGNVFGEVTKGSLMRIKKAHLAGGDYAQAEVVVPLLFAAQDYNSGIYIYDDYVYFATPTTDKNKYGDVQNTMLDFKCAKLDGTDTMGGYFFRSADNAGQYRFVEMGEGANKAVYCIYVENGELKSFNTKTYEKKVLVKGADAYYFDQTDAENGKVYYKMSVTGNVDSDEAKTYGYNQIYAVTPDAKATTNAEDASYTVSNAAGANYRTYDFDKDYLQENTKGFDASDYTTYPYVNLGELVLDGFGSSEELCPVTQYNQAADVQAVADGNQELRGYSYILKSYQNGGLYFTRAQVLTGTPGLNMVYYLADATADAATWNTVAGNYNGAMDVVSLDDTKDDENKALYTYEGGVHEYFYVKDSTMYKEKAPVKVGDKWEEQDAIPLVDSEDVSGATLLFLEGDYLYYYESSSTNLSRINYTSDNKIDYVFGEYGNAEYMPTKMMQMDFNTDWYKPEFVGNVLLYSNAKMVNSVAYNYIYALDMQGENGLMTAEELNAVVEKYDEVKQYIEGVTDSAVNSAMTYVFRCDSLAAYKEVEDLYSDYQKEEIEAFAEHRESTNKSAANYATMFKDGDDYYDRESYYVNQVGNTSPADKESIAEGHAAGLLQPKAEETDDSFPVWAIVLISVGGGLLVAAAIAVPCVMAYKKKKKAAADRAATAVRKRKKIDTTDDKTIDVYADDKEEQTAEPETVAEADVEEAPAEAENAEEVAQDTTDETQE